MDLKELIHTVSAVKKSLKIYKLAINTDIDKYRRKRPIKPVLEIIIKN